MHGKRNRHGTPYSYCQPRNRHLPDGHPTTVWVREDELLAAITLFFNTYVLGPERVELVTASLPAAQAHVVAQHHHQEESIRRRLQDINENIDNLVCILERTRDPNGQLAARTQHRVAELEQEPPQLTRDPRNHQAAAPVAAAGNVAILDHMPIAVVDLSELAADRLHGFLDAFKVEIHYDNQTERATVKAEISGDLVNHVVATVAWAARPRPARCETGKREEEGPADDGGAHQTIMHSSRLCPRPGTTHNCAPNGRLEIAADLPIC